MAARERSSLLKRAIESTRKSFEGPLEVVVVVNGARRDKETCEWLEKQSDLTLIRIEEPSLPNALLAGRRAIVTPFFATLDDDDEFLPGSNDMKMRALLENPELSLVVTNGYARRGSTQRILYSNHPNVGKDPLVALFSENWLHNCNGMYRSNQIGIKYFENGNAFAEWTWLAFRISLDKHNVRALDVPGFIYNDTSNSLSKSGEYYTAQMPLFKRMLEYSPPRHIARLINKKIGVYLHAESENLLVDGDTKRSFVYHLLSLVKPEGWRYASYTRHFLNPKRLGHKKKASAV